MVKLSYEKPKDLKLCSTHREIRRNGVERIKKSIETKGFNNNRPLGIIIEDGQKVVPIGGHRLVALQELDYRDKIPCMIYDNEDSIQLEMRDNQDEDNYVPEDLFDNLNRVQMLKDQGKE